MGCPADDVLIAMVEHQLPAARFAELEVHIDSCEQCRKAIAAAATSRELAQGTPTAGDEIDRLESIVDLSLSDRYVIEALLGRGGMGTVYLARDKQLGRDVALKVHRAGSGKDRLQREAMAMAKLAHPNVVTVFEIGELEDRMFVAMEYVRGTTLRGWLDAKPRTWREVLAMLGDAGAGLAAAHAAGLVHRDFKPENVLVGDDGRPRVGDFGLARVEGMLTLKALPRPGAPALAEARSPKPEARLTQTGTLLGTPAYMAPEQLAGDPVDARCDQFAFAVVAWECLYGRRPFGGTTIEAISEAIDRHELAPPRKDVPDRVRRVLERGLAVKPEDRYPDLPAMLAALRGSTRVPRRRIALAALGVAAAAVAAIAGVRTVQGRRHAAACERAGDAAGAGFDELARARLAVAFVASRAPYAREAFEHTADVLARRSRALADRTSAACLAGAAAPAAAARRACLAEAGRELAGLVDVLAHPDAATVQRATSAAWSLADPASCDDARALLARPPATAASAPELAAALAHVKALEAAGRYQDGVAAATELLAAARAHHDRPLELATLLELGDLREQLDDPAKVAPILQQAQALAEALGRDLDAASALDRLAHVEGVDQHDYASAHRSLDLARAKLERLGGGNVAIDGTLRSTEAEVLFDENRLGEAETAMRRAVALLEQAYGADHPELGAAYGTLAQILLFENKPADALVASQRALAILTRALGDDHPTTAGAEMTVAQVLVQLRRFDEARAQLLRADAVFRRVFGEVHPARAAIYGNLGDLEQLQQHWDAARAAFRTALGILERTDGPRSPGVASAHADVARVDAVQGRYDDAVAEDQQALAILEQLGPDAEPRLVSVLADLADAQLGRHQPALALPIAERAVALASRRPDDANAADLADARFVLARALWDTGRDRARAHTLAEQARAGEPNAAKLAEIGSWLAAHP